MTITVPIVSNTQTFGSWLSTTNRLANLMSQNTVTSDSSTGGSITTGNSFVNGHFGANFLYVANTLIGGNISSNSVLKLQTNLAVVNSTANVFVAVSNGNIGIGTSTPNTALTVNGSISANSLTINGVNVNTSITSNASAAFTNATTFSANATNLTNGTVPSARLSGTYGISISGTANNSTNFDGQPVTFYTNATNISSGTLAAARLNGTYNIDINGTANNSTNLNGQTASFYTDIPARLGYTPADKAGETFTGDLTISKANPLLIIDKQAAGQSSLLLGRNNGVKRWELFLGDAVAEAGGDTGSRFAINRYNDAGAFLSTPLFIDRATGAITLTPALPVSSGGTGSNTESGARTALLVPITPAISGYWAQISVGSSTTYTLPAGGTWAYFYIVYVNGLFNNAIASIDAGGTSLFTTSSTAVAGGFAWRIS